MVHMGQTAPIMRRLANPLVLDKFIQGAILESQASYWDPGIPKTKRVISCDHPLSVGWGSL